MSICVGCGICCDGTLFTHAVFEPGEQPVEFVALGLRVDLDRAEPAYLQPCSGLADGCCTIYDHRPQVCRRFRCALLRRVEDNGIDEVAARAVIRNTLEVRERLGVAWRARHPGERQPDWQALFRGLLAEVEAVRSSRQLTREEAELLLDLGMLSHLIDREFKKRADAPGAEAGDSRADESMAVVG